MAAGELEALFERYREHDDFEALARVFDLAAPKLLALARHLAPDAAAAEDLVQATFLVALEQRARFEPERDLLAWLVGILTHKSKLAQALRARVIDPERLHAREELDPALDAELREFVAALEVALQRLPPKYREVLRGNLADGKRPEQLARELGREPGTVRVQLHRGLTLLRRLLPASFALGLGVSLAPRGLAALKLEVLRSAQLASAAAGVSTPLVLGGSIVGTKSIVGVAALIAALGLWWFARGPAVAPEVTPSATLAAASEPAGEDSTVTALDDGALARIPVAPPALEAPAASPYGALDADVVWYDGTPAAGVGLACTPLAERWRHDHIVDRTTDDKGRASFEGLLEGRVWLVVDRLGEFEGFGADVRRGERGSMRIEIPRGIDVRGRVVDSEGRPVSDASLWSCVLHLELPAEEVGRSRADGSFLIRSPPSNSCVFATGDGLGSSEWIELRKHEPSAEATVDLELRLRGPAAAIEGTVFAPTGEPVAGAHVALRCSNSSRRDSIDHWPYVLARSNADGRFRATGLHPGGLSVLVAAPTHPMWSGRANLQQDWTYQLDVKLGEGVTVRGTVRDPDGAPLAGIGVSEEDAEPRYGWSDVRLVWTRTSRDGSFELHALTPGKFTLAAIGKVAGVERRIVESFDASAGAVLTWDVIFGEGLKLVGRAQEPSGKPLVGWSVKAFQVPTVDIAGVPERAKTDADGRFAIENVRATPHSVDLYWTDGETFVTRVTNVRPGGSEIRLVAEDIDRSPGFVSGSVVDARGAPLADLEVAMFHRLTSRGREMQTDAAGHFRLGPLQPGAQHGYVRIPDAPEIDVDVDGLGAREERDVGAIVVPDAGYAEIVLRVEGGAKLERPWVTLRANGRARPLDTDDGFTFKSGRLWPGTYRLHPIAINAAKLTPEVEIKADETTRLELELPPGTQRVIVFKPAVGDPALGKVHVVVRTRSGAVALDEHEQYAEAGLGVAHGYRVSLPAGRYRIDVDTEDGRSAGTDFEIVGNRTDLPAIVLEFPPKP